MNKEWFAGFVQREIKRMDDEMEAERLKHESAAEEIREANEWYAKVRSK